jgi:hypothetical protein
MKRGGRKQRRKGRETTMEQTNRKEGEGLRKKCEEDVKLRK